MTLLENEEVLLRGRNECKKSSFILLTLISTLHVYVLASIVYLFAYKVVRGWIIYLIATIMYVLFNVYQLKKTYENYSKFFGHDEIVITKEKVYYNVCMNKNGEYINFDTFVFIKDINFLDIKKGLYPKRLTIMFNDKNDYVNIHCLANATEIYDYLSCLIKQE